MVTRRVPGATLHRPKVPRRVPGARALVALALVALVALLAAPVPVAAEVVSRVTVEAYNSVVVTDGSPEVLALGRGELDLQSTGNRDVRGRLQLRASIFEDDEGRALALLEVPRAEIRWRLTVGDTWTPRFTAGRSRLTWGEGRVYNAGDVINGARPGASSAEGSAQGTTVAGGGTSTGEATEATEAGGAAAATATSAADLRDETQWLLAGYFPLGRFSFVEVAALPGTRDALAAGARIQGQIAAIKAEAGYLYRDGDKAHLPYMSLQGHLGLDWYGAASLQIHTDEESPHTNGGLKQLTVSAGGLYTGNHYRLGGWTARAEALWSRGDDTWSIIPEITWSPSQLLTLFARSEIHLSPSFAGGSGGSNENGGSSGTAALFLPTAGAAWTPATGLTLSLVGRAEVGDIPVEAAPTGRVTAVVRYVF